MARTNSPGLFAAIALALLVSTSVPGLSEQNRVSEPPARRPPPPPSGPTPRTPDGKADLDGVWVVSGSTALPGDPSYTPAFKKIYDERKANKGKNKGKEDPSSVCLPNGAV